MSLLFIFGAGASYDAYAPLADIERLPLAKDLFNEAPRQHALKMNYDGMSAIQIRLERAMKSNPESFDLELELSKLLTLSEGRDNWRKILFNARYYIHDLIEAGADTVNGRSRDTNYTQLLVAAEDWAEEHDQKVILATFNYDLLIDQAMKEVLAWNAPDPGSSDFSNYYNSPRFKLYKLHGSTDWWRKVMVSDGSAYTTQASVAAYEKMQNLNEGAYVYKPFSTEAWTAYLPAISLPLAQKQFSDCPQDLLENFEDELPDVSEIIIIGWRGADTHLLEKLALSKQLNTIHIANYSHTSNVAAAQNLKKLGARIELIDSGFSDLISKDEIRKILGDLKT